MQFSAWPSVTNPWQDLVEETQHIEAAGWKGIWIGDHFMVNAADTSGRWQEAWTVHRRPGGADLDAAAGHAGHGEHVPVPAHPRQDGGAGRRHQ